MALKETLTEIYRLHGGTVVSTVWSFHVLPVFAWVQTCSSNSPETCSYGGIG